MQGVFTDTKLLGEHIHDAIPQKDRKVGVIVVSTISVAIGTDKHELRIEGRFREDGSFEPLQIFSPTQAEIKAICLGCGSTFIREKKVGRPQLYCTTKCRNRTAVRRFRQKSD